MQWDKDYRFIYHILELTQTERAILARMFLLAGGFGGQFKFKFKDEVTSSKETRTKAKNKLINLNIIKKTKKAYTYKIQEKEKWLIDDLPFCEWYTIFDKVYLWLDFTDLTTTQKRLYTRVTESIPSKKYEIRKKQNTLAKELNISKRTVNRHLKKLIDKGLIEKTHTWVEQARHRPAKYKATPVVKWDQAIIDNLPHDMKKQLVKKFIKDYEADFGEIDKKGLFRGDNIDRRDIEGRFDFVRPIENNILDSLRESEDNKLSSSSSSGNYLGGSATSKVSLNRKLFKNKTQNKNTLDQDKPKDNLEQNKSLRSKLKDSHKHEENKRNKKLEVKPSTKTISILNRWNKLCDDYPRIYTRPKQDQKNKTYREIVDSLNKLFRGTLYARGDAVLPQGFKPFEQKFTLKEVETFLERLHIQLIDPNVGVTPFKNRKANLREFLMGSPRTGAPSKLLSCCWNEPKSLNIKHTEDVETLKKLYREHVDPDHVFTFRDLEAFDKCAAWGEPLYTQLERTFGRHSNFVTMVYMSSIKSVQKVANGSVNPTLFGKEFVERMTKQRMQKLGYTL